jgi:2-oxoglutarate ferredoxin oxidoreductase subunit beta
MDFDTKVKPTWCSGCGNYGIFSSLKSAFEKIGVPQEKIVVFYGIGCHGNMSNFLNVYGFEGLHGRPIPTAIGAKIANHKLKVIVIAGDGDSYGEGVNHLISAARGNHDITVIVHNNEIYGLTTGQTSPTSEKGTKTKSTPQGSIEVPLNPLALAITSGATFVARGFAGEMDGLTNLIVAGINHNGFSLVDVLQPCLSFEKIHNFEYLKQKIYDLSKTNYYKLDKIKAVQKTFEWEQKIPVGIFYEEERESYCDQLPQLKSQTLIEKNISGIKLDKFFKELT